MRMGMKAIIQKDKGAPFKSQDFTFWTGDPNAKKNNEKNNAFSTPDNAFSTLNNAVSNLWKFMKKPVEFTNNDVEGLIH